MRLVHRHYAVLPDIDAIEPIVVFEDGDARAILGLGLGGSYRIDRSITRVERFLELIDALSDEEAQLIGLTSARRDALAMLDELRGLFATGELATARRLGERMLHEIVEAFDASIAASESQFGRPIIRSPIELGPLTEHALATFVHDVPSGLARLRQVLALAGELAGEPRTRPQIFASVETNGYHTIALPLAVVHPSTWPQAAARLGVTVDEARRLMTTADDRPDSWPTSQMLRTRLGGLLVRRIPRPPDDELPRLYFPPRDRFAAKTEIEEPLDVAYRALNNRIERYRRLREQAAPELVIDREGFALQQAVERIADEIEHPFDTRTLDGWGQLAMPTDEVLGFRGTDDTDATAPATCVWLTDDLIAIARNDVLEIRSLAGGLVHEVPLGGASLQTCDDTGRYLLVTQDAGLIGLGCYDTALRAWLERLPAQVPAASFSASESTLFEHRRGGCIGLERGTSARCWARGNRAVFLHDERAEIRSTHDGLVEVGSHALAARAIDVPILRADGTLAEQAEHDPPACAAIAKHAGHWRFLLPSLHVADVDRTLFRLGFPIEAACFSPDGSQLALLTEELVIVDVANRAIVRRA